MFKILVNSLAIGWFAGFAYETCSQYNLSIAPSIHLINNDENGVNNSGLFLGVER
jgi:hypothetical protein